MKYFHKLLFFNLFTLFFIFYDEDIYKCNNLLGILILTGHHYLSSAILLSGILFQCYLLNLFLILTILIGLIIFKDRCQLTLISNKICSFNQKNKFKNFAYHFSLLFKKYIYNKPSVININYISLFILIFINVIMIM